MLHKFDQKIALGIIRDTVHRQAEKIYHESQPQDPRPPYRRFRDSIRMTLKQRRALINAARATKHQPINLTEKEF